MIRAGAARGVGTRLAATLLTLACAGGESRTAVEIGRPAPPYAAVSFSGDSVSLKSLRGKVVLLNIWATWCAPCKEEIPYLQRLHTEKAAQGLEVVGVSVDAEGEESKMSAFAQQFGMTYPLWHDPDQRVMSLFLAIGVPATYLIDREGVLVWRHLGVVRPTDERFQSALADALRTGEGG